MDRAPRIRATFTQHAVVAVLTSVAVAALQHGFG
jgi:hypothetical protein